MTNEVPISLLKPHPKNGELFPEKLPEHLWQEMVSDIRENGIINPLVVAPDYTVLAGHLRLEAAKEAGLTHVPVVIRDVDPGSDEAVSLLIRDNLLRRQLGDVQIARLIKKLKEIYGIRQGRPKTEDGKTGREKHEKISQFLGLSERHLQQLDKLNDLIPDLHALLESGRWNATTVASIVGSLPSEEQQQLLELLGESGICGLSVREARELKKLLDAERREKEALQEQLASLEEEKAAIARELADLQDTLANAEEEIAEKLGEQYEERFRQAVSDLESRLRQSQEEIELLRARVKDLKENPVEKVVEKVVYKSDPELEVRLEALRTEAAKIAQERDFIRETMRRLAEEGEQKETKIRNLKKRVEDLEERCEHLRKELVKKEKRPKPDPERAEALDLARQIREEAVKLAESLAVLTTKHINAVRSFERVSGAPDLEGMADVVSGAFSFALLDLALRNCQQRITQFYQKLQEAQKPVLKVLKGGVEEDEKENS